MYVDVWVGCVAAWNGLDSQLRTGRPGCRDPNLHTKVTRDQEIPLLLLARGEGELGRAVELGARYVPGSWNLARGCRQCMRWVGFAR